MHNIQQAKEGKNKKEEQFRDVVGDGTLKVDSFGGLVGLGNFETLQNIRNF
jgi:hypothetical protein